MDFYYDESGNLLGFSLNGVNYYYVRNNQNDVIGILDSDGSKVVSYIYDSWGSSISTTGSLADTIGMQNPFRYRGYYYDVETGFYLTATRYYDPEIGRFINADTTDILDEDADSLLQYNLFAYCWNNPVNMDDHTGESPANIIGGIIGSAVGAAAGILVAKALGLTGWKKWALIGACTVAGAVLGAVLGPYVAKLAKVVGSGVKAGAKTVAKKVVRSTGRTTAKNLSEQIFMKSVKSNPLQGAKHLKNIVLKDSRWSASKGWIKMQRMQKLANGRSVVVHFVYNTITGKTGDFKFK